MVAAIPGIQPVARDFSPTAFALVMPGRAFVVGSPTALNWIIQLATDSLVQLQGGSTDSLRSCDVYSIAMMLGRPGEVSPGFLHGPKLLILDEPTNGLDLPHGSCMIRLTGA